MASWSDFAAEAPSLAARAAELWPGMTALDRGATTAQPVFAIAYLATVRDDGSPRLHPFCPILAGGRLFAAIPRSSPKGRDLVRDRAVELLAALPYYREVYRTVIEHRDDLAARFAAAGMAL